MFNKIKSLFNKDEYIFEELVLSINIDDRLEDGVIICNTKTSERIIELSKAWEHVS